MKSILKRILALFLWTIIALFAAMLIRYFCDSVYNLLHSFFAEAFPLYNPINEKADYEKHDAVMSIITLSLSLVLTVFISLLTDNERYEHIIKVTDGLYDVKEALTYYKLEFIIGDILASVIVSAVITIPLYFIPERLFALSLLRPLVMPNTVCSLANGISGYFIGAAITLPTVIIGHLPSLILSLKAWRARWLTSFSR